MKKRVIVHDSMQQGYAYFLAEPVGKNFQEDFHPELTPKEMLTLGVFGGRYMTDCKEEFPASWFVKAKLSHKEHNPSLNFFKVNASQSLGEWRRKGWINPEDPRGWFQWYCRYYIGRRISEYDQIQIKRWKAIRRHLGQIKIHCEPFDFSCRPKQRQALLHWAYDTRKL